MAVLTARNVSFRYRGRQVLHDVTVTAGHGQVLAVVGPNGAGKTTLLKCLQRLLTPAAGSIEVGGRNIADMPRNELARTVAYVPQATPARFPMSVFDTVLLGRRPYLGWRPTARDLDGVAAALEQFGLGGFAGRNISELSGGERQKVAIAKAVAQQSEVLLLDEPTAALDLHHQLTVLEAVRGLAARRQTTVVATVHDLNLAVRLADQIAVLHKGRAVAQIRPDQLGPDLIRAVWQVDAAVIDNDGQPVIVPVGRR